MPTVGGKEFIDCRNDLLSALTVAQDRRDRGKANEGKRVMYQNIMNNTEIEIGDLRETGNHLKEY